MEEVNKEDKQFLDDFLNSELTEEGLKPLDERLKNANFKKYYQKRLNQQYSTTPGKLIMDYLPMIILIALTIIGIYLIVK